MLSEFEKLTEKKRLLALPPLERPLTVRLKFRKVGTLQYISHLDLQRTFNRVIVRASIPVWYTKGFNPHIKMVFSTPLSVGAQSEYEFLDIRIDRMMDCGEIKARLNRELTEELCILDAYIPESDFSEIAWASYQIVIHSKNITEALATDIEHTMKTSPLIMTKRTKAGDKDVDLIPMIHSASVQADSEEETLKIRAIFKATSTEFLNPELLISALKQKHGILSGRLSEEWYEIMRTGVMKEDFSLFL